MFTGIVTDIGTVKSAEQQGDLRLVVGCAYVMEDVAIGASIACSGVCLTVVEKGEDWFAVDVSGETVSRTATGLWAAGSTLNLERALKVGDELGGHIVTGHVDGVAEVEGISPDGESQRIWFRLPPALAPYVASKGSITIDGVSLTVNDVADADGETRFSVNLIPHTQSVTTLGALAAGRTVNIEIDVLARYLQRIQSLRV